MSKINKRWKVTESFVWLPRQMLLNCEEWKGLKPGAKVLYLYLKAKFNGSNNGEIRLHYSELHGIAGFKSDRSISTSIQELEAGGWIERTRRGGLYRFHNLFRLTGKYDSFIKANP